MLPNSRISELTKLKEYADNDLLCPNRFFFSFQRVEKQYVMGKNAGFHRFSFLISTLFCKKEVHIIIGVQHAKRDFSDVCVKCRFKLASDQPARIAQADPRRHFTQMSESPFLRIASHISIKFRIFCKGFMLVL